MNLAELISTPSDINQHLKLLAELSAGLDVVEIGFRTGVSARAFLHACKSLRSIDIKPCDIGELASDPRFRFEVCDSAMLMPPLCDMLFIDGDHSYEGVLNDLSKTEHVRRYIALHDTDGRKFPRLRKGVLEWLDAHPEWFVLHDRMFNHGLMVLERR